MDTGPVQALGVAPSGLATRRGNQNPKPLSVEALKLPNVTKDNGVQTPRTSRSHLLAGLRTAPRSAGVTSFGNNINPNLPSTTAMLHLQGSRIGTVGGILNDNFYSGPKTSLPQYGASQNQARGSLLAFQPQYTADQILAPPEIRIDQLGQDQVDSSFHAHLVAANAYLSQQKQVLQQQLLNLQVATKQLQGINLNDQMHAHQNSQLMQMQGLPQIPNYQIHPLPQQQPQPQHFRHVPQMTSQPRLYVQYDPVTGQPTYYVDQSRPIPPNLSFFQSQNNFSAMQQQQLQPPPPIQQQAPPSRISTPRVQVSPPPPEIMTSPLAAEDASPPRRYDSPEMENPSPLPPPSANAFRRGHKKSSSLSKGHFSVSTEAPRSPGPKTATFPISSATSTSYGPGQARAGEHPIRQPRGPPSFDQLSSKPTSKHEGSKNFAARTRRSAVHNLVRAVRERRKEARSSGSNSPVSDRSEELPEAGMTDNDADSVRSGSGSLMGDDDIHCSVPSSRMSWGAIGSDRPSSRRHTSRSGSSNASSDNEGAKTDSFASLLKGRRDTNSDKADPQRRAPMLVLTNAEKRKSGISMVV